MKEHAPGLFAAQRFAEQEFITISGVARFMAPPTEAHGARLSGGARWMSGVETPERN